MIDYLRLVRVANAPSAISNVWAGYVISSGMRFDWITAGLGALASVLLYSGGMALNDFADRKNDATEHPERPIPSGKIKPASVLLFGVMLVVLGASAAGFAAKNALPVAALLAASIFAYDFILKKWWPTGGAGMGLCRALNVVMGMALAGNIPWTKLYHPAAMFVWVFGLTVLARKETANPGIEKAVKIGIILIPALDAAFVIGYGFAPEAALSLAMIPVMFCLAFFFRMT